MSCLKYTLRLCKLYYQIDFFFKIFSKEALIFGTRYAIIILLQTNANKIYAVKIKQSNSTSDEIYHISQYGYILQILYSWVLRNCKLSRNKSFIDKKYLFKEMLNGCRFVNRHF